MSRLSAAMVLLAMGLTLAGCIIEPRQDPVPNMTAGARTILGAAIDSALRAARSALPTAADPSGGGAKQPPRRMADSTG
jgi:hypothetical protein